MVLAGPVFHISIQYIDFVKIFNVSLGFLLGLLVLVGVYHPLCPVVILSYSIILPAFWCQFECKMVLLYFFVY